MKTQKHLLPNKTTNFVNPESGELAIQYRAGYPRTYRFDASRGLFSVNGENNITKKGEPLTFIPVAFRVFRDDILGYGLKKWVEFFFVNDNGQLCSLLFHGYSVENLERKTNDLFYDSLDLCQVLLTASPVERVKQNGEGKGNKYFIAEFSYKPLENVQRQEVALIGESVNIWRADTLTGDVQTELSVNFRPPIQLINGAGTIDEKAASSQKVESSDSDNSAQTKAA